LKIYGDADRYDHRQGNDDYTQPGNLFRLMLPDEKERLFANLATAMDGVPQPIIRAQLAHFEKADPEYAAGVATALGIVHPVEPSSDPRSTPEHELVPA
jgi:catalase